MAVVNKHHTLTSYSTWVSKRELMNFLDGLSDDSTVWFSCEDEARPSLYDPSVEETTKVWRFVGKSRP